MSIEVRAVTSGGITCMGNLLLMLVCVYSRILNDLTSVQNRMSKAPRLVCWLRCSHGYRITRACITVTLDISKYDLQLVFDIREDDEVARKQLSSEAFLLAGLVSYLLLKYFNFCRLGS